MVFSFIKKILNTRKECLKLKEEVDELTTQTISLINSNNELKKQIHLLEEENKKLYKQIAVKFDKEN